MLLPPTQTAPAKSNVAELFERPGAEERPSASLARCVSPRPTRTATAALLPDPVRGLPLNPRARGRALAIAAGEAGLHARHVRGGHAVLGHDRREEAGPVVVFGCQQRLEIGGARARGPRRHEAV